MGPRVRDSSSHRHFCAVRRDRRNVPGLVTGEGSLRSARNLNGCHLAGSEITLQLLAIAQAPCPSIQRSSQIPCVPTALPFVILYTLLASLLKTSLKYYVKMVQIILWHWVQQAGDSLQLCHRAVPGPALDGHIQLVTKTARSLTHSGFLTFLCY